MMKALFLNTFLAIFTLAVAPKVNASYWIDYYGQNVWLGNASNLIVQHRVLLGKEFSWLRPYAGLLLDEDGQTDSQRAFTDSQVAALVGVQTPLFFYPTFPLRAFVETRYVNRLGSFPDARKKQDWEGRFGVLGSGRYDFDHNLFLAHYFAVFYTRLYGERVISEGWWRQGYKLSSWASAFHELYVDSYDLQYDRELSFDSRPGVAATFTLENGLYIESSFQYIRHWNEVSVRGKDDWRVNLIFALYR